MAALQHPSQNGRLPSGLILVANLLPVVGLILFGWRAAEILVIYWIEVVIMVVGYSIAALFAERSIELDDRRFYIVGFSKRTELDADRWSGEPEALGVLNDVLPASLAALLPPMYRRNVPVVGKSLGVVAFLAMGWFYIADVVSTPIAALTSPTVVVVSLAMCVSQAAELRREFFVTRRYEEWSPYMVLEAAQRVVFFYLVLAMIAIPLAFVGLVVLAAGIEPFVPSAATVGSFQPAEGIGRNDWLVLAYVLTFSAGKTVVDWSRHVGSETTAPKGIAGWLMPEDPRPEWQRRE